MVEKSFIKRSAIGRDGLVVISCLARQHLCSQARTEKRVPVFSLERSHVLVPRFLKLLAAASSEIKGPQRLEDLIALGRRQPSPNRDALPGRAFRTPIALVMF